MPKKKGKKKAEKKADKGKGKAKEVSTNGAGASIVEADSDDVKPKSRRVMVEEVEDDEEPSS